MKRCVTAWLTVFSVVILMSQAAFPQMTLVSSTPADGEVSVVPDSGLVLQFSSPLDTTVVFDDFFLGVELFPENDNQEEPDISLSDDLTTMTVKGIDLQDDTRYTLMLWGAVSTSGDTLDKPYVITWTTGDELPVGQVNGEVSWADGNPSGALVALFDNLFEDDPIAITTANPTYSANYIPDGSYYVVSIREADGDGSPEFMRGDAVGVYDANSDGIPDPVEVVNEDTLYSVDIALSVRPSVTAKEGLAEIEGQATGWASDAALAGIFSEGIETDGTSSGWMYLYYSQSENDFRMLFDIGDVLLNQPLRDDEERPEPVVLQPGFIDSDSALTVALGNGLSEFLASHEGVEGHAGLHTFYSGPEDPNDNGGESSPDSGFSILSKRFSLSATLPKTTSEEGPEFIWYISFYTKERMRDYDDFGSDNYFDIGIDAYTGAVIFGGQPLTARQTLDVAEEAAKDWAEDAQLLDLDTYGLNPQGRSDNWHFKFYSQSKNELFEGNTRGATVTDTRFYPKDEYYNVVLIDVDWIDSDSAVVVAKANGLDQFLSEHPGSWGSATLEHFNFFQTGERPMYKSQQEMDNLKPGPLVWRIHFEGEWDGENQPRFEIVLDAESGNVFLGNPSQTARHAEEVADSLASLWATDAKLQDVASYGLNPEGLADLWFFQYGSAANDSAFDVAVSAGAGFAMGTHYEGEVDTLGVSDTWFDSDSALVIAHENGLGEYMSSHPGVMGVARLVTSDRFFGKDPYEGPNPDDNSNPDNGSTSALLKRAPNRIRDLEPDLMTLWSVKYYSIYGGEEWQIIMNAETGDVLSAGSSFSTARESFDTAMDYVSQWADDAGLVDLEGPYVMPDGRGDQWIYNFFSATLDSFLTVTVNRGLVFERWTHSSEFIEHEPPVIDFEWIDSDSATSIAMQHGLAGIVDNEQGGGANGWASLRPYRTEKPFFAQGDTVVQDSGEVVFAWSLVFNGYNGQSMAIDIDAETGEVLFIGSRMTAREAFEYAFPVAGQWRESIDLLCIESRYVSRDGRSDLWAFKFSAPNVPFVLVVEVELGRIQGFWEEPKDNLSSLEPLPEDWQNSGTVAPVADGNSKGFRDRYSNAWVEVKLSRGLWDEDMEKPVWGFRYHAYTDNGSMDSTFVLVDAVTASMIVAGVESGQNGLPQTFALEQNYPNPFNPETNIRYQLAKQTEVRLVIYNVLGQKLMTLVDEVQAAGSYDVRWNGRDTSGVQQPSGMYIYRIESKDFTNTRKMLLVR